MPTFVGTIEKPAVEEKEKRERPWFTEYSRDLRKNMTEAELIFDQNCKEMKFKRRRQKPITVWVDGHKKVYIADFRGVNQYRRHIIEIDGGYHNTPEQKEKDALRTKHLEQKGYIIHRITNEEIFQGKGKDLIKEIIEFEANTEWDWRKWDWWRWKKKS